jgi:2-hydroxy-6-oxonona-2,4-dienedioate hydrolase
MPRSLWTDLGGLAYEQGYVDARGIRTRYLHAGRRGAPPLVLLHGFGGHAEAYQRNLAAHAPDFDVWSLDMLGHGYTDKPDRAYDIPAYLEHLAATLDALQIARAHFSGESLGGWVAASFAIEHPDRVDRLVLNTMGGATMDLEVLETVREKTLAAVQEPRRHTRARLEWLMADPAAVNDDIVECRARIYEQPGMVEAVRRGMVLYEPETRARYLMTDEKLARIAAPTLVIWTTKDPTAAPAVGERIARAIPRGRYRLMQRCGHWPQWEDPETFNRLHLDFLLGRLD